MMTTLPKVSSFGYKKMNRRTAKTARATLLKLNVMFPIFNIQKSIANIIVVAVLFLFVFLVPISTYACEKTYFGSTDGDLISGTGCSLGLQTPSIGKECASCVVANQPGFRDFFVNSGNGNCNNRQIINYWAHGGIERGPHNFYEGDVTMSVCNCSCARELANPTVDYGESGPTKTPTSLPIPTVLPTSIPLPTMFSPTTAIPTQEPPYNQPSPFSIPTLPPLNEYISPTIPFERELKSIQLAWKITTVRLTIFSRTSLNKAITFINDLIGNFIRETSF